MGRCHLTRRFSTTRVWFRDLRDLFFRFSDFLGGLGFRGLGICLGALEFEV